MRLSGEQFDKLSAEAENAGIPVSTLARVLILRGLTGPPSSELAEHLASLMDLASGSELLERLRGAWIRDLAPQVQDVVRESVHDELKHTVRPEFLREPA